MEKILYIITLIILLFSGCNQNIDFTLDETENLKLLIFEDNKTFSYVIHPDSNEFKSINNLIKKNQSNWGTPTLVPSDSIIFHITIYGKDFRIQINNDYILFSTDSKSTKKRKLFDKKLILKSMSFY